MEKPGLPESGMFFRSAPGAEKLAPDGCPFSLQAKNFTLLRLVLNFNLN